ncbi:MAG: GIY-YIG nuclease family protein [Candidatus Magasanikbacteria bacterium]
MEGLIYCVYILWSKMLEKKYIGFTSDLRKRIKEHNSEEAVFTSKGIPWQLIYYEAFHSKKDAVEEERFLKSGKGRDRIEYLLRYCMENIRTGSSTG